jgi:hypothetical protein
MMALMSNRQHGLINAIWGTSQELSSVQRLPPFASLRAARIKLFERPVPEASYLHHSAQVFQRTQMIADATGCSSKRNAICPKLGHKFTANGSPSNANFLNLSTSRAAKYMSTRGSQQAFNDGAAVLVEPVCLQFDATECRSLPNEADKRLDELEAAAAVQTEPHHSQTEASEFANLYGVDNSQLDSQLKNVNKTEEQDLLFMRIALDEAHRGGKEGEVPIGAVLVQNGGILARAHNRWATVSIELCLQTVLQLLVSGCCKCPSPMEGFEVGCAASL